jgi:TrmH RNA methyltransferase
MRNKLTGELAVCGFNAAMALGKHHPETINRLFLREDRLKSFAPVCKKLAERKRPYKICGDEELEKICKSPRHQGVAAMIVEPVVEPLSADDLELWAREGKTGLVLHSVGNDHNLGAIIRAAAFFDAHFVVISEGDPEARLTTSAYRVAEGGMEHVTVRSVRNTAAFLKEASRLIVTLGTDTRARRRIGDLHDILREHAMKLAAAKSAAPRSRPGAALILGSEETS